MPTWLPSIPYTPFYHGYWLPETSTLNWCEEDYYATPYAAEIVNTLTNLLFIYFAYLGIQSCRKHHHDTIFLISFIGYLLVGSGSFFFHATLKYPMQLVDELSMIYTTCLMCYATFSYARSRLFAQVLGVGLVGLAVFITAYYHYLQDPRFHQIAYVALTVVIVVRQMWVMETMLRGRFKGEGAGKQGKGGVGMREDKRDEEILRSMWTLIGVGLSTFLAGFGIWHLDNVYCSTLRGWRREVGLPWGIVLEGHGWWHLMTGTGAYFYIIWGIWLRHCLNGKQDDYELEWPSLLSLPEIVKTKRPNGKLHGNGTKKIL